MAGGNSLPKIKRSSSKTGMDSPRASPSLPSLSSTSPRKTSDSFAFSPPRCSQTLSPRDELHMTEVARKKKEREGMEELWKLQVDAEKQFQEAIRSQKLEKERKQHDEDLRAFNEKRNAAQKLVKEQIANRRIEVEQRRAQLKVQQEKEADRKRKDKEEQEAYMRQIFQAQREADEQFVATIKDKKEREMTARDLAMRQRASEMKYRQEEARRVKEEMITRTREELRLESEARVLERRLAKQAMAKAKAQRLKEHEEGKAERKKQDLIRRKEELAVLRAVQDEEERSRVERKKRNDEEKVKRAEARGRVEHEKMVRMEFEKLQAQKLREDLQRQREADAKEAMEEAVELAKERDAAMRQEAHSREKARRVAAAKAAEEREAENEQRAKLEEADRDEQIRKDREFEENVKKTKAALQRRIKYLQNFGGGV